MTDGADLDWLGLERRGPGEWTFELTPGLSRFDAKFYGGTGVAVAAATIEAETGRRALWVTAQFVASADTGDRFTCRVEIPAAGRRTSQARVTGWHGDRLVFTALGAAGDVRAGPLETGFGRMPDVPPPGECPPWGPPAVLEGVSADARPGWLSICEGRSIPGTGAMWMRMTDRPLSAGALAFLADVVPSAVVRAAGRVGAGTSLDNTVRFGPPPTGQWMLVDVEPHLISGGYVHGTARLWSEEGILVGVASQTAGLVLFD